jgi:MoaA/NifB/PqqE/SkfB family radical SAM enzyme
MPIVNFQTWEMCQLNCKFCLYSRQEKLSGGWSLDDFKKTVDNLVGIGIDRLEMTPALGEITLDPTWLEKVKYADGKVGDILIYTNGLNLKQNDLKVLLGLNGPLTLKISIYGDSRESYLSTTGKDLYEQFQNKIKMLKSSLPLPENKRIGVDIRFKKIELPLHVSNMDIKNELWRDLLILGQTEKNFIIENRPSNSNWGMDFPNLPNPKTKEKFSGPCDCMNVTLNPNGDALICNVCHPYDERYVTLGNVLKDPSELIFNRFNDVKENMRQGIIPEICKKCTEYNCKGDTEEYYDNGWKIRPKRYLSRQGV